jgi:hypothetical protein
MKNITISVKIYLVVALMSFSPSLAFARFLLSSSKGSEKTALPEFFSEPYCACLFTPAELLLPFLDLASAGELGLAAEVLARAAARERAQTEQGLWPALIDVPTGAGKTSALDIAVYTLACAPTHLPRRVVLVVDRRIVVDQAGEHALRIAGRLAGAADGPLRVVADALRALWGASPEDAPLAVAALRTMFIGDQFRLMSPQKTGGLTLMHGKKCTPLHAPASGVS